MHKHRESIKGKVKKVFVFKQGKTSYYNIKLNKHIIASSITGSHIDMMVDGFNAMVDKKREVRKQLDTDFGFSIIKS